MDSVTKAFFEGSIQALGNVVKAWEEDKGDMQTPEDLMYFIELLIDKYKETLIQGE